MKKKKMLSKYLYLIPTVLFLATIFYFFVVNCNLFQDMEDNEGVSNPSFYEITRHFEAQTRESFHDKYPAVNLNGYMTRVLGLNTANCIQRFENGWLDNIGSSYIDFEPLSNRIYEVANFFDSNNIPYLYLPIPSKGFSHNVNVAPGYENSGHAAYIDFINALDSKKVNNLNMDKWFEENGWSMENTYFKTDHHWRPEAAFIAVQQTMEYISEKNSNVIYDRTTLDLNNWSMEETKECWMGLEGRRVGSLYGGLDDISFIYPKYKTDVFVSALSPSGSMCYFDSIYDTSRIPKDSNNSDLFSENAYALYLRADYPVSLINNKNAVNNMKVIVVGDSFKLPYEAFLSTQFTEIYQVDLRSFTQSTFAEYVKQICPDYVLMVNIVPYYDEEIKYDFKVDKWYDDHADKTPVEILRDADETVVEERENTNNYNVYLSNMDAGAYEMTFDNVSVSVNSAVSDSPCYYVQASVMNLKTNEIVASRYIYTEDDELQKWYFTVPDNDDSNYAIVFFAGVKSQTKGVTAIISGITLSKFENVEHS